MVAGHHRHGGIIQASDRTRWNPVQSYRHLILVSLQMTVGSASVRRRWRRPAGLGESATTDGILFTHVDDGSAGPGRAARHSVEPFLEQCGFTRSNFEAPKSAAGRTAITFLSTG
jgi:hypothetical protein